MTQPDPSPSHNDAMRQTWSDRATGWVAGEAIFDAVFAPVTAAILEASAMAPGQRLLDVGCGSGTLLAAAATAGLHVVGVDISAGMVEAARRRVPTAAVVLGDAQSDDLLAAAPGRPFDLVVSRFGVMFFDDPVAAFTNIGRAATPGAALVFACWRGPDENPMFTLGTSVLTGRLSAPPRPPRDAPGPVSLADPRRVTTILRDAGWAAVTVEPFDFECDFGFAGTDGVEERLTTILATSAGSAARAELRPLLGAEGWASLLDDVRAELRGHLVGASVRFPGACWLVTAHRDH